MKTIETFEEINRRSDTPLEKADALVRAFKAISRAHIKRREKAIDWFNRWYTEQAPNDSVYLRLLYCKAYYCYTIAAYDMLFRLHHESKHLNIGAADSAYMGWISRLVAYSAYVIGLADLAIENAFKALSYFKAISDDVEVIRCYTALGVCYSVIPDYALQITYFNKGLRLSEALEIAATQKSLHNNIAYTALLMDDVEMARTHVEKGLKLLDEDEESVVKVGLLINACRLTCLAADYEEALRQIEEIEALQMLKTDMSMWLDLLLLKATVYKRQGKRERTLAVLTEGLEKAERIKAPKYIATFTQKIGKCYASGGAYKEAYAFQERYTALQETLEREKASFQYLVLRIQNEVDVLKHEQAHLSEALESVRKELRGTQEVTIYALATLAEFRDQVTGNHILRTSHYVKTLCECLDSEGLYRSLLTPAFIKDFSRSACLHDIGKVGVSDLILNKPGKLTPEEFEQIKKHVVYGREALAITEKILGDDSFLKMAQVIAYTHHEKWDGSGYPEGLSGTNIPVLGRIMSIIDVYDALISKRPYKAPYPHLEALEIIKASTGTHFDPEIASVFIKHHRAFYEIAERLIDTDEEQRVLRIGM